MKSRRSLSAALLAFCLISFSAGCATPTIPPTPPPRFTPDEPRPLDGNIALVTAGFEPRVRLITYSEGRPRGAAKGAFIGAATGAATCVIIFVPTFGGVYPPCYSFLAGTFGAVGGVAGAVGAVPKDTAREMTDILKGAFDAPSAQENMASRILASVPEEFGLVPADAHGPAAPGDRPDYKYLGEQGFDSTLEVNVLDAYLASTGGGNPLALFGMDAGARLVETEGGRELYSGLFRYQSMALRFERWAAEDAMLLRKETERAYVDIAERIAYELFLSPPSRARSRWSGTSCEIKPISPERKYGFFQRRVVSSPMDSLQPVLEWEPFPGEAYRKADREGALGGVSDVTYELIILKDENGRTPVEVYRRTGLTDSSHTVKTPLEPGTEYLWSVRAWYRLDGKPGRTQWAFSRQPFILQYMPMGNPLADIPFFVMAPPIDPCGVSYIPYRNYFRFSTSRR